MKKQLHIFSIALLLMFSVPVMTMATDAEMSPIEQAMDEDITIIVSGQCVQINGGQGQTLEVVSLTGRRVMTVKIESPAQRVELNVPKGCYILKIGKVVRKVAIQ